MPTPLATHRRDLDAWFTYARKRIGWSRNLNRKHLTQFFARHDSNGLEEEDREKLIEMRRRAEDLVRETGGPEVAIPIWTPPASVKSRNESVVPAQTSATSKRTRSDDEDDNEMEEATNKRTRYVAYEKSTDEPEWCVYPFTAFCLTSANMTVSSGSHRQHQLKLKKKIKS